MPRLAVVGANHRSASLSLRDALFVDDETVPAVLAALKQAGLDDVLVLSTCDRVEVWTGIGDAPHAARLVAQALADKAGLTAEGLAPHLYTLAGPEAARHIFAVTSALDSLIIGEPHVPGQVKAAHRIAREQACLGAGLDTVCQAAFACAKRVRSETPVGEGPVSIAAAAVQLARDLHGALTQTRALLVGAGDMGELIAESLLEAGLAGVSVTAPRASRAEALATSLRGHVVAFENLRDALAEHDIVIAAVGGRSHVLTSEMMGLALKRRRRRPMFLVDAAVPGDVEPAVLRLDGAFLYDLTDLERIALKGRAGREQAARAAWTILNEELDAFVRGRAERAAVPAIVSLRARFEDERERALAESPTDAAEATRLLINRLLHDPATAMKEVAAESPEWQRMAATLKTLFRLE